MKKVLRTRAVVFDLDGTLLDSLPLVLRAFSHAIEPYAPRPTMDIFGWLGGPPERVFHRLLGGAQHVPAALERLAAYTRDQEHTIQPFAGVAGWLEQLRAESVAMAIWTGRDRRTTLELLAAHKLGDYFDAIVCGDDLPTHKPDPAGLTEILLRLKVEPAEAVLIGDADVDVLGGVACGVDTILIQHSREVEHTVLSKAWRLATSPAHAYERLRERLRGGD